MSQFCFNDAQNSSPNPELPKLGCNKRGGSKRGCNKRGCLQTQPNADKCAETQTNENLRLSEKGPKMQINAQKREQTQTNVNNRKIRELHPFYALPFAASQQRNAVFTQFVSKSLRELLPFPVTQVRNPTEIAQRDLFR